MALDITRTQRSNLKKLATYLESLPADYEHFGMWRYFTHNEESVGVYEINKVCSPCGTAACAVGHGPNAGIKPLPEDDTWNDYSKRAFGFDPRGDARWEWCFGSEWRYADDTHYGAAARIRYLLKAGRVPEGFWEAEVFDRDNGEEAFAAQDHFTALYAPFIELAQEQPK